jgi:FkbM family methyltransferase
MMTRLENWRQPLRVFRFYVTRPQYIVWWLRNTVMPRVLLPARLHGKSWWLAANDFVGKHAFLGEYFENAEQIFLQSYLKEGMIFLDIGAHHGLYTLLASEKVGTNGQVIAFEPSDRELARLRLHLQLNGCKNVRVEPIALGNEGQNNFLYICVGEEASGLNSLRPPATDDAVTKVALQTKSLDNYLSENGISFSKISAVKMDVEGGELEVLRSAAKLLTASQRPIIMCEAEDVRTKPWGYLAIDIFDYLVGFGFICFTIAPTGKLKPLFRDEFKQGNLVAVPADKQQMIAPFCEN